MKKIIITGSAGAGKTTLACMLGDKLSLPVHHLDKYFWKPNWTKTPREEWIKVQQEIFKNDSWIIDGNYGGTVEIRLKECDTLIFLDYPRTTCLCRVIKRYFTNLGKTRPDMGPGCKEAIDYEFLRWIWNYPKHSKPIMLNKVEPFQNNIKIISISSDQEKDSFLASL